MELILGCCQRRPQPTTPTHTVTHKLGPNANYSTIASSQSSQSVVSFGRASLVSESEVSMIRFLKSS